MQDDNPVGELVEKLGGTFKVAALVGLSGPAVSMWRARGSIPPEYYFALADALEAAGKGSPPKRLFGFPEKPTVQS